MVESNQAAVPKISYPGAFTFGVTLSAMMGAYARRMTWEPLCARPFHYLFVGAAFGFALKYWDY